MLPWAPNEKASFPVLVTGSQLLSSEPRAELERSLRGGDRVQVIGARRKSSSLRSGAMVLPKTFWWMGIWIAILFCTRLQVRAEKSPGAYFLPEFALSPQGSFLEDTTGEQFLTYRYDDQTSRITRSDEEKDGGWDAWGAWSDCSRTCGGGASYSLRRCLNGRSCEGQNIRYKTCSNNDCPSDAGDFRAQQCSAYNDVQYQGHYYEWLPIYDDSAAPCALKCQARGQNLVVELAPKVLDGTRCNIDSLDMCISGICQAIGCDRQLGSHAKEDNCGVCAGDGSTCRLVRGQSKSHVSPEKREENVIAVPLGSRSVRITVKGPAHLFIESKTLQGSKGEHSFAAPGVFVIENTTVEFLRGSDRETFKIPGPLGADFIFKTRYTTSRDSVVQFFFYQPISHQWRQTDFFPCTVTCGGGYQLNSAECVDVRLKRVVPDHYCHYYPENTKPKPKLKECSMDPCPSSDGFKEIMPYDHFQPLPRWEHNPWTACSVSCGGGIQRRSFVCVEESMHGEILQVEEWKCMYAPKPKVMQTCNLFDCPKWIAMEWSQCTVTCGRGLRYRVVLCINHNGQHVGGCNPQLKLHIKEECIIPVPCYKPKEKNPVEAKLPWFKQAQELEETRTAASEEPTFIPEPWSACSTTCGPGIQVREVKCRVLLTFTQTETELPEEECESPKPSTERPCLLEPCDEVPTGRGLDFSGHEKDGETIYDWEYVGFTPCSATCLGGKQEAIARCLHIQTQQAVNDTLCDKAHRPPAMTQDCNTDPCPPRWQTGSWRPCSATCGVGIQTRDVYCLQPGEPIVPSEECQDEKPHVLQACSQFDCPPGWHIEEWQQCSRTCGGGTQYRRVTCRQLLTDGSFLNLSDELCQEPRASSHKSCARTDCPPQLVLGDWSKCSVSCGVGIQRRKPICQKLTSKGRNITLSGSLCRGRLHAPLVRSCRMTMCNVIKPEVIPKYGAQGPQILGIQRVYIQTREEKRINFTIGGRAYLLPKTSVVIKCPVRRFQKSLIRWEKDGQRLQNSKRLGITKSGSMKIHSLEASDIGLYQCIAGPVHETFVLKLIGTDNRLIEPPAFRDLPFEHGGIDHNEANSLGATWHKMRQIWSQQNELFLDDGQVSDQPLLRALVHQGNNPTETSNSLEFKDKCLEAAVQQGSYSMDTVQFEELIKNMSQLIETGEVNDDIASQVIYEVVAELAKVQPTREKWKGAQVESSTTKVNVKTQNVSRGFNSKNPNRPVIKQKGLALMKQSKLTPISLNKTINSRIGSTVFITRSTEVINLFCDLVKTNDAKYVWTKDGAELQPSEKIILDGTRKVEIRDPTREEQGVYGCTVVNHLGSETKASSVLYAEVPVILTVARNFTELEHGRLTVIVGGTAKARVGANITIRCPAKGVPQPNITWLKRGGSLSDNAFLLLNGSLLLKNVSLENEGTYVCTATNALGKAVASFVLHLAEPKYSDMKVNLPKGNKKHILMASNISTNISVTTRHMLHIAEYNWEPGEWTYCSATCGNLGSRIQRPQCMTTKRQKANETFCDHLQKPQNLVQPCNRRDCPPRWLTSNWSECSVSCGNGFRHRQITCERVKASGIVQSVSPNACAHKDRPLSRKRCLGQACGEWPVPLGSQCLPGQCLGHAQEMQRLPVLCQHPNGSAVSDLDCDERKRSNLRRNCSSEPCDVYWRTGPWRPCTAACGNGFQSRKVECIHRKSSRPVAAHRCGSRQRPVTWKHCNVTSCGKGECKDTTHYCTFVKHLNLCSIDLYKQRCCQSCQEA